MLASFHKAVVLLPKTLRIRDSPIMKSFQLTFTLLVVAWCLRGDVHSEPLPFTVPPSHGAPASINSQFLEDSLNVDQWTQRFEGESREVYRARLSVVKSLGLRPGEVVADVGAGTGLFLRYLSDAVGKQGKVIAQDISPVFVRHMKERVAKAGLSNVTVQLGGKKDVKLKRASVDMIFLCDTYHHFEDPPAILATMRRALKPGGRLVVIDYHRIPGKTKPFLMQHVRAGQEVFAKEIRDSGFTRLPDPPAAFLEENYLMVFKR